MLMKIKPILLASKLGIKVNCYLLETDDGFILIDTGFASVRSVLEEELGKEGCRPGNLKLIAITHGDSDHTGNCAYLRQKYGAKIIMHSGDSGMVERGDWFWNRKKPNILIRTVIHFFELRKSNRFIPDSYVEDGYDLSAYGLDAHVVRIPGHSKGSVGIVTKDGDLFCGDLFTNLDKPTLNSLIDDPQEAAASVSRLKESNIVTVYPGHGKPFPMDVVKR